MKKIKTAKEFRDLYVNLLNELEEQYKTFSKEEKESIGGFSNLVLSETPIDLSGGEVSVTSQFTKIGYDLMAMFSIDSCQKTKLYKKLIKYINKLIED